MIVKNNYFSPNIDLVTISEKDVIRTSGFEIKEANGDGDRVSINIFLDSSNS